jgi:predicted AAA+ superfamily ATPase
VYNNALLSALENHSYTEMITNAKEWGRLVESSIGSHLINCSIVERYELYYWRENNNEVDFVIEKNGKLIGIEVKSGRRAENKGMSVFAKNYKPDKILLVGTGGIGIAEFLRMNPKELFN